MQRTRPQSQRLPPKSLPIEGVSVGPPARDGVAGWTIAPLFGDPRCMPRGDGEPADRLWAQVVQRDMSAKFVYSVASTGIYCRPACPSRRPLRENVAFHDTPVAAELAGFRPCKRCHPRESSERLSREAAQPVVAMCKLIEVSETAPSLKELAVHVGFSESHAHRVFSKATGLSPTAYREAIVRRRVEVELPSQRTVSEAIYAAGYGASSRFYEQVGRILGMSPRQFRRGAPEETIRFATGQCSFGSILVAATARGVCAVLLGSDPDELIHDLERRFHRAHLICADATFDQIVAEVVGMVEAQTAVEAAALPLDIQGTAFQQRVWRALQSIPRGTTATYSEIAAAIGAPRSSRAVARACADNRIAVLIPCHRVVRIDGSLSGYRWGIERKRELLKREGVESALSTGDR